MRIRAKTEAKAEIPTASMPDIIFMLLVFFMVTTVLREFEGLNIALPSATRIEKLESKRHTAHVWISKDGLISIDDKIYMMNDVRKVMYSKISEDPKLTTSLKVDKTTPMKLISEVHQELRFASALKVSYAAKTRVD